MMPFVDILYCYFVIFKHFIAMANKNFDHVSHIKSKLTREVLPEEFYGLTPTADNSDAEGSSPVKLNLAKRPTAQNLIDGEIAVNYKKGHETLTIKNDADEIVGFVNENNRTYDFSFLLFCCIPSRPY